MEIMTKEEIKENNLVIAQFMGYEYISKGMWKYLDENYGEKFCKHSHLINFHSDWNCLMKAVQKINTIQHYYLITISDKISVTKYREKGIRSYVGTHEFTI